MPGSATLRTCLTLLLLTLISACGSKAPVGAEVIPVQRLPDFSGAWEIDYKRTEDPQQKLQYLYDIARSQVEQQQKMNGDQRRPPSNALMDLQGVIRLGTLADAMTRATVLNIDQSDEHIRIKRSDDFALTCDFLAPSNELQLGQESCHLDAEGRLVFVVRLPEGLTIVNRYSLYEGDGRMETRRLLGSMTLMSDRFARAFTIDRVYMQFPPGEGTFKCEFTLGRKKTCWMGHETD